MDIQEKIHFYNAAKLKPILNEKCATDSNILIDSAIRKEKNVDNTGRLLKYKRTRPLVIATQCSTPFILQ
jgi:hypothetical protein